MNSTRLVRACLICAATIYWIFGSHAAQAEDAAPSDNLMHRDTMTGNWDGARSALGGRGVTLGLIYIGETLGNFTGGVHQGWVYDGRVEGDVDLDLSKLAEWTGATIHASAYQMHHAHGLLSADYTGSIGDPSNIEARETIRLFTLWLEQSLFGGKLSIRAGQIAADDEFMLSPTAGGLIDSTFGWGPNLSANQVQGGPAYPLAIPGLRVQVNPTHDLAILGSIFFGDPAGHDCTGDPQACNEHGTTFSFSGEPLFMAEFQYNPNNDNTASAMPGSYKIGGWYGHSHGDFTDQRVGVDRFGAMVSQAAPSAVRPLAHKTDWGFYGIADQMVWRNGDQSVSLFMRAAFSPADRNLVTYYIDGGVGVTGLIPGRLQDTLTFGTAFIKISTDASTLDEELSASAGGTGPRRDAEAIFELSYTMPIAPWFVLQPDLQYIVHPGGNVPDTDDATKAASNAFIGGIRFTLAF